MESNRESSFSGFTTNLSYEHTEYTVLVPLQGMDLSHALLPPAIRAAKRHYGKVILLNIIEIPYQLPPSEAEQFKLEREFKLEYARQIIETAGCKVEIMVRIAHRLPHAIEQLANSLDIDLIVMWAKNKELLWNKEIYQKLYGVNCDLLVAKEQVETQFDKVIIQVDELQTACSMIEHATYLLGNEEGSIHMIPAFSTNDEKAILKKVRSIVDRFHRQNPWFTGKTIIHQVEQKFVVREYLKDICHKGAGSTGVLVPYPSGRNSGTGSWFKKEAQEFKFNLPVFLSKVGRIEPIGINQLTNKLKNWMGIISLLC